MSEGEGDGAQKRSVALTAAEWSALVLAVSHGVKVVSQRPDMPVAVQGQFLKDVANATEAISLHVGGLWANAAAQPSPWPPRS